MFLGFIQDIHPYVNSWYAVLHINDKKHYLYMTLQEGKVLKR
jgi:hypothetical protein